MTEERIKRLAEWLGWKWPNFVILNGEVKHLPEGIPAYYEFYHNWDPITQIQDAWMLVEKARELDYWFSVVYKTKDIISEGGFGHESPPFWEARFRCIRGAVRPDGIAEAPTAPEAICAAIEKLMEGTHGRD